MTVWIFSLFRSFVRNSVVFRSDPDFVKLAQKPVLDTLDSKFPLQAPPNLFSNIK